jgi:hypothetical protein
VTTYAAAVALKDPAALGEDIELSRWDPDNPNMTLTITIVNENGTAFEIAIKAVRATTSLCRAPTPPEQALADVFRQSSYLMHGVRPAQQVDRNLYHWQHGEPPPEPAT